MKLYLIDALNFLFRSYYAIGPMSNLKGEPSGALFGFIRSINKIIKDFEPTHFCVVFDGEDNKSSRTKIYKEYKSHRVRMPEDLAPQLEHAVTYCKLAGIPTLTIPGVEADDTIGSIAKWAEHKGAKVYICSSDKDLCQLVSDHIFLLHPHKDNLLIDRKKVKELFGVEPEQIIDLLAMMGDASDNIPGLEGFGAKTAASLLQQHGSLKNLLAHPEKVGGKKGEILKNGKEIALISHQLATLQLDVDFPKQETFFLLQSPDLANLKEFYHQMHFMTLLKELGEEKKPQPKGTYELIDSEEALSHLIGSLEKQSSICLDVESTDLRPMRAHLVGIGFCVEPKKGWYIPKSERALALLRPLLENKKIGFYGHNIKYDLHVLLNEEISVGQIDFDTMIASYLLAPHKQKHNLDDLCLDKFGKVKVPIEDLIGKGKNQKSMADVPLDQIAHYCCEDVEYTCRLKRLFEKELDQSELKHVFYNIELPLIPILTRMERSGIYVDVDQLKEMSRDLGHELRRLEKEIYHLAGHEFNINSPKQLSHVLFEKMGIKPPKKTATGFSTAADVLEQLQDEAPVVKKIMEYRLLEKLRSTYVDTLPDQVLPSTGRIHCTFMQSVAATGRLSCQDPNLQNIPIRSAEGKKIRAAFKPQLPHYSFVSGDYSQIELRLLAHLSEDPALLKAFCDGQDIHAYTASLVFNVPLKEVSDEMRFRAKAVNFGILYGQQAFGLSQGLDIEFKEAATFIDTYFKRYPRVKEFLEFCKESARKTGRAITLTGRQRPIPDIESKNPMLRAASERLAVNTPLQGTAADLIKMAMIEMDKLLLSSPQRGKMLLQIHDELLFETPDNQADNLGKEVKRIMEGVLTLKVPLIVDISIGKNWGEC